MKKAGKTDLFADQWFKYKTCKWRKEKNWKNRSLTDQWFKLKQNTKNTTRSIKKKSRKQWIQTSKMDRSQNSRTISRAAGREMDKHRSSKTASEPEKEGRKQSGQILRLKDEQRQKSNDNGHQEGERTNFPKVIGRNKLVSLKLFHS